MPSIYDVILSKKMWVFNGALLRTGTQEDKLFDRAYPSIGLQCEAFTSPDETDGDGMNYVPSKHFYSWTGAPAPAGTIHHHASTPQIQKVLRLRMHEPDAYQHELHAKHPDKFPSQGEMCDSLKKGIEKLLFIEHGDYLISNPLLVKDPLIKGGEQLSVVYVIRLVGDPGKWGMIVTGYWSDGYLGTGGWC